MPAFVRHLLILSDGPPATGNTNTSLSPPVSGAAHRGQGLRPSGADLRAVFTRIALFGQEEMKCSSYSTGLIQVT